MANFVWAIALVLKNEGSTYTVADGNPTKFGLTLRYLQDNGYHWDAEALEALSLDQAKVIYQQTLWQRYGYGALTNQLVANYLFDMAVHIGQTEAITLAQRGIWAATQSLHAVPDGILGAVTIGDINNASQCYLPILRGLRIAYYVQVVERDPTKVRWLDGWLQRAIEVCI